MFSKTGYIPFLTCLVFQIYLNILALLFTQS
nr:MAG TPA: hypothetical protein [Caudoviricetes sp.]